MIAIAARIRTCPDCGRRWRERDARFCGACGATLANEAPAPARRRLRAVTRAAVAVAGIGTAAIAVSTLDLALPERERDATVGLDDEPPTADSPLSSEEVDDLRARANPDRLRCDPEGCELWRIGLSHLGIEDPYAGVVALRDDLLLIHAGHEREGADADSDAPFGGELLAAVDPTTGRRSWEHTIPIDGRHVGRSRVRLVPGPHGALVLTATTITSMRADGEVVWSSQVTDGNGAAYEFQEPYESGDVLVFQGWQPDRPMMNRALVGLDRETGRVVWEQPGQAAAVFPEDVAVSVDHDGTMRRLDPATGETMWATPIGDVTWLTPVGDWVTAPGHDAHLDLVHVDTGARGDRIPGEVVVEPVEAAGGVLVLTYPPPHLEDDDAVVDDGSEVDGGSDRLLHHVGPDGSIVWSTRLESGPAADCCRISADEDVATVTSRNQRREYALADGELRHEGPPLEHETPDLHGPRTPWFEVDDGTELRWDFQRGTISVRTEDGVVHVRGGNLDLASLTPLILTDGDELIAVRIPGSG